MEMPKPVGCVLIALRSFPEQWHVPSFEMAAHITLYASLFGSVLRDLRARRSMKIAVARPVRTGGFPDDDLSSVRVWLLSEAPTPLPEYTGDRIGCADHPLRVGRRCFCFQLDFFAEDDSTRPIVSARLFLDPDETRMDTFVPSDCGILYRADEYRRYLDSLVEANEPDAPAGQDRIDADTRELAALLRKHMDGEHKAILDDLNERAKALLARAEQVALRDDSPKSAKPNLRKHKPN